MLSLATSTLALWLSSAALSAALPPTARSCDDGVSYGNANGARNGQAACVNGPITRGCWSDTMSIATDMDADWPNTGRTVTYELEVTNVTLAPDGFSREMLVFNGQYPGPTIEADWGDTLSITVKNSLQYNGTSIHWHGLRQLDTNQMDGTNGLTECPIAPGQSKTYTFKATQHGSSWYHSHYSVQYGDGLVGGIVINGPATANYDVDLGPFSMTDWFHTPLFTVNAAAMHAAGPPTADNVLLNGSMTSRSGGSYATTTLTPGATHRLRLINAGINDYLHVSLDGHPFTVIAADFTPIVPYTTSSVVLAVGQRYDVLIHANQTVGNYWLRVGTGGGGCDGPNANAANIRAVFHYDGAVSGSPNSTGSLPSGCRDETFVPYVPTTVPSNSTPSALSVGFAISAAQDNLVQWLIDDSAMSIDWEKPTLEYVLESNDSFPQSDNVYRIGSAADEWQFFVMQQSPNNPPLPHPIHLHGHDFYVLAQAEGATFPGNGTDAASLLNFNNPPRRDTATLPARGYLVVAFQADNPGAWLMHCHIPFHISSGLGLQFVEREADIAVALGDLHAMQDGCRTWDAWVNSEPGFTMGDSGL